jgi:hypothetical protein
MVLKEVGSDEEVTGQPGGRMGAPHPTCPLQQATGHDRMPCHDPATGCGLIRDVPTSSGFLLCCQTMCVMQT